MLTVPNPIYPQRLAFSAGCICIPSPAPCFAPGYELPCQPFHVFTRQLLNSADCERLKKGALSSENKSTCERVNRQTSKQANTFSRKLLLT
jgi:hypothetical protein